MERELNNILKDMSDSTAKSYREVLFEIEKVIEVN